MGTFFTHKTELQRLELLSLLDTTLILSKEVKYFGIWLDSKLLWGKHLDHITTKVTNVLWPMDLSGRQGQAMAVHMSCHGLPSANLRCNNMVGQNKLSHHP